MAPRCRHLFFVFVFLCVVPSLVHAQASAVRWSGGDLSATDKEQILELAARLGLKDPAEVSRDRIMLPLGCSVLRVESQATVDGNRRTRSRKSVDELASVRTTRELWASST